MLKIKSIIDKLIYFFVRRIVTRLNVAKKRVKLSCKDCVIKTGEVFEFNFLINNFSIGTNSKVQFGENLVFRDFSNIDVHQGAKLTIGNNVFFNRYCSINCLLDVQIGDNTIFGEGVKIYDHNHLYHTYPNFAIEQNGFSKASIKIGKNCWIGSNVTILKGVCIGDNVIIGANNLIFKSIKSNSMIKANLSYIDSAL